MKNIIIFGVGAIANFIYEKIDFSVIDILGFVNPYTFRADNIKEFKGYPVYAIEEIKDFKYDYLLIASGNVSAVKEKILQAGLEVHKAVAFIVDNDNDAYFSNLTKTINQWYTEFLNNASMSLIAPSYKTSSLYPTTMHFLPNDKLGDSRDFVRYKQLELLAQKIYGYGIDGSVAECGVYKGDFSRKINEFFPDRNLYLFDTFEGFDARSIIDECPGRRDNNVDSMQIRFSDTNVDYVLSRMPNKEKCIVKKGFFPETFDLDLNEKFAFVSLDMDLYQPILDGLRVFYPKLSKGGFIMVHDYNNFGYPRCKEAVDVFCKESGAILVPLTDFFGSVLIAK